MTRFRRGQRRSSRFIDSPRRRIRAHSVATQRRQRRKLWGSTLPRPSYPCGTRVSNFSKVHSRCSGVPVRASGYLAWSGLTSLYARRSTMDRVSRATSIFENATRARREENFTEVDFNENLSRSLSRPFELMAARRSARGLFDCNLLRFVSRSIRTHARRLLASRN